ncbi:hypothetical protein BH23ACT8_BH23ACT8_14990 [soil metagenome]
MASTHRLRAGPAVTLLVAALAVLLAVIPLAGTAQAGTTTRLTANDNVEAALAFSEVTYDAGTASEVFLARDNLFADSLASGSAQGAAEAPLLLNPEETLDPRVVVELERLGAQRVIVLGGSDAVGGVVDTELDALGYEVERVFGRTRIETAVAITERFFPSATRAVVARAFASREPTQAFADSMATGVYSAGTNLPVLYTQTGVLTGSTRDFLASSTIIEINIAGGTDAVSEDVADQIRELGIEVNRLAGSNRFVTAIEMAADRSFTSAARTSRVVLVDSMREDAWAPGFAAAAQTAGGGAPLVLAAGDDIPRETREYLEDANGRVSLLCAPYVSQTACDAASEAVGNQ